MQSATTARPTSRCRAAIPEMSPTYLPPPPSGNCWRRKAQRARTARLERRAQREQRAPLARAATMERWERLDNRAFRATPGLPAVRVRKARRATPERTERRARRARPISRLQRPISRSRPVAALPPCRWQYILDGHRTKSLAVSSGGYYSVSSITSGTTGVLTNLGYPTNAAVGRGDHQRRDGHGRPEYRARESRWASCRQHHLWRIHGDDSVYGAIDGPCTPTPNTANLRAGRHDEPGR